jgi:hypothetical protein
MKKVIFLIVFLLFFLCLTAAIQNPDIPEKGRWDFKLQKVWEVNRAGSDVIGRPMQVLVTENGHIVVHDVKFATNRLFGPDGQYVTSFGKRGEGPGEVKQQNWAYVVGNKVAIPDGGRIHYFNQDGSYDKSVTKPFGLNVVCFVNENEFIAAPLTLFGVADGKAKISLYDIKSQKDKLISHFEVFEGGVGQNGDQVYDIIMPGLSPMMIVGYHEDRLFYGMNNTYSIHVSTLEGKKLHVFSLDRKKRKVSRSSKEERFKNSRMPENVVKQIVDSLPGEIACFERIEVHLDMIYVYVANLEHWKKGPQNPKQIDIFSPDGRYLYRSAVRFDGDSYLFFTPFSNLMITDNYLVAALEDSDGEVKLVKYRVELPGPVK